MSTSDIAALQRSLSLIGQDKLGCFISSPLFDLGVNLLVNSEHRDVSRAIRNLQHDLWQISAIASRLTWMREMLRTEQLDEGAWMAYCRLDIEHFYVQLRSSLDYLAVVIAASGLKKGQLPESFTALRNYALKHPLRMEAQMHALLCSASWFEDLRTIRDSLVHEGAEPMVFSGREDWLLFQVHGKNSTNLVTNPFMLHNENVAYFQRFAAWSFAHTLCTLDQVGVQIAKRYTHEINVGPSKSYDFTLLRSWMNELLQHLQGST